MSTPARRRLMRDFKRLQEDPPTGVSGAPSENNIMLWNAVIFGPVGTPFEDGKLSRKGLSQLHPPSWASVAAWSDIISADSCVIAFSPPLELPSLHPCFFYFFLSPCLYFSDRIFVLVSAGTFKLLIEFSEEYPNKPPTVRFVSRMFHPNVYADGSICLDILQNRWSPTYDVSSILTSIQSLLDEPNPNSPANSQAAQLYQENKREYEKRVTAIVEQSWADS
ncbi:unnamed protein product [Tetraodon nigroviridis]|nr:unnamed protein product [Tetraodon nigroviridis]